MPFHEGWWRLINRIEGATGYVPAKKENEGVQTSRLSLSSKPAAADALQGDSRLDMESGQIALGGFWNRLRGRLLYKVRCGGAQHLPIRSGALLVSNHVSPVDPLLIRRAVVIGRNKSEAARLVFLPAWKSSVYPRQEIVEIARAGLRDGKLVCLFAEGAIPRSGKLLRFTPVIESMVRTLPAVIIPVAIDRPWGPLAQERGEEVLWKWPRPFPYPVTVAFGEPLQKTASPYRIRRAVQELQASLFAQRKKPGETLPRKFVRAARRFPFRLAMVDHTGRRLSFLKSLAGALVLRRMLRPHLQGEERVGVLLPPSIGAALTNVALSFLGKVVVNLNYTKNRPFRCSNSPTPNLEKTECTKWTFNCATSNRRVTHYAIAVLRILG